MLFAQQETLGALLGQMHGVEAIRPIHVEKPYQTAFEIKFRQPLDHSNPTSLGFTQRLYLSHVDYNKPMVLVTEGYARDRNATYELSKYLRANQLIVEHRYFGKSVPDSLQWEYLKIKQAADDHMAIIKQFKKLYKGKWISTGISKGGQTSLYLKYFYPDAVDATVPYVAPINLALEDPRIYEFLRSVGDEECRTKIFNFQRRLLEKRAEILPLAKWYSKGKGFTFNRIGLEAAFEYAVLEYSFSFWQWGLDCTDIPSENASTDELLENLINTVGFSLYMDEGIAYYEPHFYQAINELGYYGFETKGFEDLLKVVKEPTNTIFAPEGTVEKFDPTLAQNIHKWLTKKGERIAYIYGELDTWSATALYPKAKLDALQIMMSNRAHGDARIKNMTLEEKARLKSKLEAWLSLKLPDFN